MRAFVALDLSPELLSIDEAEAKVLVLPVPRTAAIELRGLDAFPVQRRTTVI